MINTIWMVVKMILALLPFVLLCLVCKKINLPKTERSKQFAMPVIGVIYTVISMICATQLNQGLLKLIRNIPKGLQALSEKTGMSENVAKSAESFINGMDLEFWIFYISNTVLILLYIMIKKISIKIISKVVKTDGTMHGKVAENFYSYFTERNAWCLRDQYVQMRDLFRVFYYAALILSSILMVVSRRFYVSGMFRSVFYPIYGIVIVGELYFYLDGVTKQEYVQNIIGEDEDAYKTVNYSLLRKFLRSVFGDKLLAENTSINNSLAYGVTTEEIIRELEKDEDSKISCFASYVDALNKTGFSLDHNYLYSSLDMLKGKSVLFNNPFYNDLIPYAFYPMNRILLSHQKVLVVLGRHSIEDDMKEWLERGIEAVTNIPFMWKADILSAEEQDLDIGIVTRSDVLNMELHNANVEFLSRVGFIVIIEPSKLISSAQIGLNMLVKQCCTPDKEELVYCMCDQNCDGLVDAMSHILMTSITEVSATEKHQGTSSYMCWQADEDYIHHRLVPNISRYLGVGTELSFAALKNQVSKTKWYGGDAFPVTDIRWIDKQYYYELTKYAGLPTSQKVMDEHFETTPNFWSAQVEKNSYLTVEDESFNMFEILRNFSTRATEQGFINVISPEYLLKDYMAENASIFEADPKAIPLFSADYTRSSRNTVLRLVLMMSTYPVPEDVIQKELSLLGITIFNLKKQLWYELYNCYSEVGKTKDCAEDYRERVQSAFYNMIELDGMQWGHELIRVEDSYNLRTAKMETTFSVTDRAFLMRCVSELKSAEYIAEDEKGHRHYLGAELAGQIYQKYLPGQFFTFGGKYYEMLYLTAEGQVMVRRAADHINGRPSYRQIREYVIQDSKVSEQIGAQKNIAGMKIVKEFADICVRTPGYYQMKQYHDFTTAKLVSFEGEANGIPTRLYRNKEILRIELPQAEGKYSDNVRYTLTVLMNEIFKTLFAENQAYITALTDLSFMDCEEAQPLTYTITSDKEELNSNSIYIVEDSQLDLGLTVTVERNLQRIFNMLHDYLDWHMEHVEESRNPKVEEKSPITFVQPEEGEEPVEKPKKKGIFSKMKDGIKKAWSKIKGWFKKKPKEESTEEPEMEDAELTEETNGDAAETEVSEEVNETAEPEVTDGVETVESEEETTEPDGEESKAAEDTEENSEGDAETEEATAEEEFEPLKNQQPEKEPETQEENPEENSEAISEEKPEESDVEKEEELTYFAENEKVSWSGFSTERRPYHERYYLLFGRDREFSFLDLEGTEEYLSEMGMQHNPLKQARDGKKIIEMVEATYKPGKPDARYCDFCGEEIYGVEFETLADGRDRCLNCGRTAIKTGEEFRRIFEDVKRNMESFFGIRINAGVRVEMVNAKTLHKRLGHTFVPTPQSDGRILGVAIKDKNGYTLMVENGSPRMASMLTMAHELTHIWQYINWNDKAICRKYGKNMRLEIYEGMAKWVEIQYAYLINEPATAKREEIMTAHRDDEYGHGFLRYRANYPFSQGTVITKATPFMNVETPLQMDYCGAIQVKMPTDGIHAEDLEQVKK